MSRRILPAVYIAIGRLRRDLAAQGIGPTLLHGVAANPGMPAADAQLLDRVADLIDQVNHVQLAEFPSGGLPIYEPRDPSPARMRGDRHGLSHPTIPEA